MLGISDDGMTRDLTTVVSFSRSGSTDTYTTGQTFTRVAEGKSGYYQDGGGTAGTDEKYLQLKGNTAYWTETPASISFTAKLGGGSTKDPLDNNVIVSLLDVDGNVIANTTTVVTTKITSTTGSDFTVAIPAVNNVYGVKISHVKESGYNVRYYSFSLSYEVASTEPAITLQEYEISVPATGKEDILTVQYQNIDEIQADIQYYYYVGDVLTETTAEYYEWFTASIDDDNNVNYLATENESTSPRNAYFKVWALDNEAEPVYSDLVTVTQAGYVPDYATLPFEYEGGVLSDFTSLNGTSYSLDDAGSYAANNAPYRIKFTKTGDYLQVKCNEQPGNVTIGVKVFNTGSNSKITVQGSADGETFTNIEELTISASTTGVKVLETTASFDATHRYVRLLFTKGVNVGVGPISIAKAPTDPYITLLSHSSIYVPESPYQMEFTYSASGGPIDQVVYGNFDVELTAESFQIQYCDAEGNAVDDNPDWFVGETPKVVLNQSENKLYLEVSVAMNTVADPRTAYFKVGASNDGPMFYSDVVIVNQTGYVPAIAVNPAEVAVPNEGGEGQLTVTYDPFTFSANPIYNVWWCDENGNSVAPDAYPWLSASFGETRNVLGWQVTSANESEEPRIAYLKVEAKDDYNTNMVYSNLVTITQAAQTTTYSLVTSINDIEAGAHYIIAGLYGSGQSSQWYAMGSQGSNFRNRQAVTVTNNTIEMTPNVHEIVLMGVGDGFYTIYDESEEGNSNGYLYASGTGSSNYLSTYTTFDNGGLWEININPDNYKATIIATNASTGRNSIRYNHNSSRFSCYASGQQDIYLFKKNNEPTVSYEKEIASYGTSLNGGYYLIASPVGQVTPAESNEFLTNDYDLYAFDQSEDAEWRNYEAGSFNLISGRGYLYANNGENVKLTFEGYPYVGNGQVMLAYDGDAEFAGWNLIGNPFGKKATLNMPYYSLNEEGSALNTFLEESDVEEMEGVFVKATGAGQSVKFTPASNQANSVSQLNIKVTRNRSAVLDNAIVRFDNGMTLDKFQLRENSTKVYFTEGNHDYSIVASEAQGELPVSFRASENGTYTISVETRNVKMDYLHLIDNMIGADVDLLATPSYSFEAKTSDYASRFRLVFSANSISEDADGDNAFAYFNGSNWTISNMGEATLQVVDVMGRVLSSETLSGNTEININQPTGVYMLRLVSGDSVKVQKVVVR